jgi:O-antigen ligase
LFISATVLEYAPSAFGNYENTKLLSKGPINIFLNDYLITLMAFILIKHFFRDNLFFKKILKNPISKITIIFFLWDVFIGFLSYSKGFEFQNVLRRLAVESLIFLIILVPLTKNLYIKKERLFHFCLFMGFIIVVFGLLKYFVFHEIELTSSGTQRSLTGNAAIILLFPLCYFLFYKPFWRDNGLISTLYVLFVAAGIHFTGHRSGWIAFLFVIAMWFLLNKNKIKVVWIPLFGISMMLMLMLVFTSINPQRGTVFGDLIIRISDTFNLQNRSTVERFSKWEFAINAIEKSPFLGLGRFQIYTSQLDPENKALASAFPEVNRAPHNMIATQALHHGLLGLCILLAFFYIVFKELSQLKAHDQNYINLLKIFILTFIVFAMLNTSFSSQTGKIFLFIAIGLLNYEIANDFSHDTSEPKLSDEFSDSKRH